MEYQHLIENLELHQTERIKIASFPNSCATTNIPKTFTLLFPNIMQIINSNITKLCKKHEILAIFSLQHSFIPIISPLPKKIQRIMYPEHTDWHFCCNLNYLTLQHDQLKNVTSWENPKAIVIDFTSGLVVDPSQYLSQVLQQEANGVIYGCLNQQSLNQAWQTK